MPSDSCPLRAPLGNRGLEVRTSAPSALLEPLEHPWLSFCFVRDMVLLLTSNLESPKLLWLSVPALWPAAEFTVHKAGKSDMSFPPCYKIVSLLPLTAKM